MNNKILAVSILAIAIIFATNTYAVGQNGSTGEASQSQQQGQVVNQGEDSNVQAQVQQQSQDGNGTEEQVQNQNQIQNQGEESQIQNSEQQETKSQNQSAVAEQRKSQVSSAVQEMLQVAERNSGIGEQVRAIAQNQTQNQEKLEVSLQKVQSRSSFAKFLIGADYGEINNAQGTLEQNRQQIQSLNEIKNQLANEGEKQNLTQQIQTLEQANLQIENSLQESQKGFSLFGWLFKWMAR
jgi:lipopolysaccharide export LptBFGC system permease protein LptF